MADVRLPCGGDAFVEAAKGVRVLVIRHLSQGKLTEPDLVRV